MSETELERARTLPLPVELCRDGAAERAVDAPELPADGRALLAIDTALGTSVAVGRGGRVVEVSSADSMRHAEVIGELIERALELSETPASAVAGVVAGVGPGPFTGLRVGIAAARAFGLGSDAPLLPLQGHEAVALAVLDRGAAGAVRVVQDARRRELFVTGYSGLDWAGVPVRSTEPHLVPRAGGDSARAGVDAAVSDGGVPSERGDGAAADDVLEVWPERIPAARLVQLAARRLASGAPFEPADALYLRQPDVRRPGAIKRVSA